MLKFIIGKPASGKTYEAVKIIEKLCIQKKESILLVPEQFTFENERLLLKKLGDTASLYTSVLSFSRLFDEVGRIAGGIAGTLLSDSDKIIFMSRALKNIEKELTLWRKYTSSVTFAKTMLDTVGEFKINSVKPDDLRNTAENTSNATLKSKLLDIAIIYEEYDTLVGEKFIDPADKLTKLYFKLENCYFFKNKTVIIDSFKGFTGQQFAVMERIISQAENVYVCLTDNLQCNKEYSIFTNIRTAVERIKKIAQKYNVSIDEPLILGESYYNSNGLKVLENFLSCDKPKKSNDDSITLVNCDTIFDEAEFAARTIRRIVREEGLRFKDFVIIARDADSYTEAVSSACRRNGVSVFYDKRSPLTAFPAACAVLAAINALNMDTENIFRFHKTGLGTLSYEEISILQNYCTVWGITGELWHKNWDMNPSGFNTNEHKNNGISLDYLNELRGKAIKPIDNLISRFNYDAENRVSAIMSLIKECDFANKLSKLCEYFSEDNAVYSSGVLKSSYDELINILDSLARCYGKINITDEQFIESFELAVSLSSVGVIPQLLDQVTFGSADRIRPSRPKIAFIIGANQGVFPKNISNNGVFNINERRLLIEKGLSIADNSVYSAIDEEFLVYTNLCCPSDKLYISYSTLTVSGEPIEPASFLEGIKEKIAPVLISEPQKDINHSNIPETVDAAFTEYCRRFTNSNDKINLSISLKDSKAEKRIDFVNSATKEKNHSITPETSKKLFGENIRMSASKFDTFSHCRFSYFCRYGLGVEELQSAEFNVMQRGTIIHHVLQCLVEEFKDNFEELKTADLDALTDKYINSYLDSVMGYRSIENTRLNFMVERLARSLKEVVKHIAEEIIQSDFKPVACELRIGRNGAIDTVKFPYSDGNVEITGSIDRVDKFGGYIRIIDYKSGKRNFVLSDILVGLNLQMLIYLYAITRGNGKSDNCAAGILYQPSKRSLDGSGIPMNGLIIEDSEIATAMDKSGEGKFAPKLSYTQKGKLNSHCTAYVPKEDFSIIFDYIERLMKKAGDTISSGDFAVSPMDGKFSSACMFCDFSAVCGVENKEINKAESMKNEDVIDIIRKADENGF